MEKMVFRTLVKRDELDEYLDRFSAIIGIRLPRPYVDNAQVVGVFLDDRLVGGYMLVTRPPFRSLAFVPDQIKATHPLLRREAFDFMEVNGLWLSPALHTPDLQMRVWLRLVRDVFFCRKPQVLLLRDARNRTMERLLGLCNPTPIYEGPPWVRAGEATHDSIQVSTVSRWRILLNLPAYLNELASRRRRVRDLRRQHPA